MHAKSATTSVRECVEVTRHMSTNGMTESECAEQPLIVCGQL